MEACKINDVKPMQTTSNNHQRKYTSLIDWVEYVVAGSDKSKFDAIIFQNN